MKLEWSKLGFVAIAFLILTLVPVLSTASNAKMVIKEKNIAFDKLPSEWEVIDSGKVAFFRANRDDPDATILIASFTRKDKGRTLEESSERFLNSLVKKYHWGEPKVVETKEASIDGLEAYQTVNTFLVKGKIPMTHNYYSVYVNDKVFYFRFLTKSQNYDAVKNQYEEWIKSVQFEK
jgi:PsbP